MPKNQKTICKMGFKFSIEQKFVNEEVADKDKENRHGAVFLEQYTEKYREQPKNVMWMLAYINDRYKVGWVMSIIVGTIGLLAGIVTLVDAFN